VHSKPKDNVSTSFTWTKQDDNKEPNKQESSVAFKSHDVKFNVNFNSKNFVLKADKSDLISGDFKLNSAAKVDYNHQTHDYNGELHLHGNSPDISGVTAFFDNKIKHELKNGTKSQKLTAAVNFVHDKQHHLGVYSQHDLNKFTSLWLQAAFTPKDKKYMAFLRANIQKHLVTIGHTHEHEACNSTHAVEVTYDAGAEAKKMPHLNQPVEVRVGSEYRFSSATRLHSYFAYGSGFSAFQCVNHKVNDYLSAAIHQDYSDGKHNLGVKFSYAI